VHPPELGRVRTGVVVPVRSKAPEISPLCLRVDLPGRTTSFVVVPGIRQVYRTRLHELIGQAPAGATDRVSEAIELYLGD